MVSPAAAQPLLGYAARQSTGVLDKLWHRVVAFDASVELFCEIALDVRARSRFAHTWFFGYANGWMGYLPTQAAYAEGGYEPGVTPFSDAGEALLKKAVLTRLR